MAMEYTLSIIKPDAIRKNKIGEIIAHFENNGLQIRQAKMLQLNKERAEAFYAIHRERPFFHDLVKFMSSGPILVMVLAGDNAIAKNRELMGATDPAKAETGTIRKKYADNIEENAVHGSDGPETAKVEIDFFFPARDVLLRS